MANALFNSARESFLKADVDMDDSIKLVFVDEDDDTPNTSSDNFLDDIAAGARVATSGAFASKTTTAGVFDAADVTVPSVSGDEFESIVIYDDTPGAESAKDLIAYIDTAMGLPTTPNGSDITVAWDSGVNKIFKL